MLIVFYCVIFQNIYIYIYLYLYIYIQSYLHIYLRMHSNDFIVYFTTSFYLVLFARILLHQLTFPPNDQGTLEFPAGVTERFVEIECHDCLSGAWMSQEVRING